MALILENVGKTFENTGQATLKNINLEIQPGEFLCVVGKSGCGKSTLLNLIAGLEAPTEGRILLNGKEVKGPGSERTVMFQEHALFPWLNVIQNIKFGMIKSTMTSTSRYPNNVLHFPSLFFLL